MKPKFPFMYAIINNLNKFYLPKTFCDYHDYFNDKENPNNQQWIAQMEFLAQIFDDFAYELNQLLYSSLPPIQIDYFEELKHFIDIFPLSNASESILVGNIEEYNLWVKNLKTEQKEYGSLSGRPILIFKDREIQSFDSLEILNTDFVSEYIGLINEHTKKFNSIIGPWLKNYERGIFPQSRKNPTKANENMPISDESFIYIQENKRDRDLNLDLLHEALVNAEFIKKSKDVRIFRKLFYGKKISHPIIWLGTNYELYFFIKLLKGKVVKCNHFTIAVKCFVNKHGEDIKYDSLRTAGKKPAKERAELLISIMKFL